MKLDNKFYEKLLLKAQGILYKFNCKIFNKYDVVNSCWDFKDEDYKKIVNKMYAYVIEIRKAKEINISSFNRNSLGDEEMSIDIIANFKTKNFNSYHQQCRRCERILPEKYFVDSQRRCLECLRIIKIFQKWYSKERRRERYLKNREHILRLQREWRKKFPDKVWKPKTEAQIQRKKESMRKYQIEHKEELRMKKKQKRSSESYKKKQNIYYENNRSKILEYARIYGKTEKVKERRRLYYIKRKNG